MSDFECVMPFLFRQTHPSTPQRASLLHIRKIFSTLRWQIKQGLPLYSQKADKKDDWKGHKEDGKWLFYQHTVSVIHHLAHTCWLFYPHTVSIIHHLTCTCWLFYPHTISTIHHLTCTGWLFYQLTISFIHRLTCTCSRCSWSILSRMGVSQSSNMQ